MALNRVFALIVWESFSGERPVYSVIPAQAGIFFAFTPISTGRLGCQTQHFASDLIMLLGRDPTYPLDLLFQTAFYRIVLL